MSEAKVPHSQYPERETMAVTVRGQTSPGWFTGQAAVWTGGSTPRIIGPFDDVAAAMRYQMDHAPGGQIFPFDTPAS